MTEQKQSFLESEGDAWFRRNERALESRNWSDDPVCRWMAKNLPTGVSRVLEVGSGDGSRLHYIHSIFGHDVVGVEPSKEAVQRANNRGILTHHGTADALPANDKEFDVVIFGFCLYLCDDADLFRIASEADRVLRQTGWLQILDFESPDVAYRSYHHFPGIWSRKMQYRQAFLWHPSYRLASVDVFHHQTLGWTDDSTEWVSLSVIRKCPRSRA